MVEKLVHDNRWQSLRGDSTHLRYSCKSTRSPGQIERRRWSGQPAPSPEEPWDTFGLDFDFGRNILSVDYTCSKE